MWSACPSRVRIVGLDLFAPQPLTGVVKYANLALLILFPVAWFAPLLRAGLLPRCQCCLPLPLSHHFLEEGRSFHETGDALRELAILGIFTPAGSPSAAYLLEQRRSR